MNLVTAVVLPDEMDKLLNVFVDSRDKPFLSLDNTDICTLFADKGTLTLYQLQGSITDIVDALSIQNQYQKVALRCDLNMNAILEEFERIGDAVTNMCISDSKTIFNCSFDKELPDDMFRVWIAAQ